MSREYEHGFENDYLEDWTASNAAASALQARTGNYSCRLYHNPFNADAVGYIQRTFTAADEVFVQAAFYVATMTGDLYERIGVYLDNVASPDPLYVYVDAKNHNTLYWSWSGSSGSESYGWAEDAWIVMEIHAKVDPAGNETLQVKMDGTLIIDEEGEYSVGFNTFDRVTLHAIGEKVGLGYSEVDVYWDDFFLNNEDGAEDNSWPDQIRLYPLDVMGVGTYTQLDRGGVDSGANWSQLDELPPDAAEWVEGDTVGEKDSYHIDNTPATIAGVPYNIRAIVMRGRAQTTIGGTGAAFRPFVLSGGSLPSDCVDQWVLTTSWAPYRCRRIQDPDAGPGDWERAAVDAAEIGVRVE